MKRRRKNLWEKEANLAGQSAADKRDSVACACRARARALGHGSPVLNLELTAVDLQMTSGTVRTDRTKFSTFPWPSAVPSAFSALRGGARRAAAAGGICAVVQHASTRANWIFFLKTKGGSARGGGRKRRAEEYGGSVDAGTYRY